MKTNRILGTLCALLASVPALANNTISHTFFSIRPNFEGAMPIKISLVYDRMTERDYGIDGLLQVVPFFSSSFNGQELAEFFLPFHKCEIVAGEYNSQAVLDNTVDIMANYFGVLTRPVAEVYPAGGPLNTTNLTFQSRISFNPRQQVAGVGLSYRQKLNGHESKRDVWMQVSFPLVQVKNDLGFCEKIENQGGGTAGVAVPTGFVGSIGDALRGLPVFGNNQFVFGKISDCPRKRFGVGDVEVTFGVDNTDCDVFHRMWYTGFYVPTGNKPDAEYIFEPVVGNNGHWGVILGGEYAYEWWESEDCDKSLWVRSYGHSHYLFENTQKRSIDLIDKQWSRYMWMYDQVRPTANITNIVPGINILTQNVNVQPRSTFISNVAFVFKTTNINLEAGYNTYYRQTETVELTRCFPEQAMIAGIDEDITSVFVTKSNATMPHFLSTQGILNDLNIDGSPRIIRIKEADLDLGSAAHPCVVAHIMYTTFGYRWDCAEFPTILGLGASYEFSADNLGLHRWNIWGKLGVSF